MDVSVKEVKSKEDMEAFVQFPHSLYDRNPYWVPSLMKDELQTLNPLLNPAFESSKARLWLAYGDGKVAGRIAGIILGNASGRRTFARFGWIDFVDNYDVSGRLLSTVEKWAAKNTMTGVQGPMGFTEFDPEGLLVEGFDKPGLASTIYNYPYYVDHLLHHSYHKDLNWVEYEVEVPIALPEKIRNIARYVEKRHGLTAVQIQHAPDLLTYAESIFELINKAYRKMYGAIYLGDRQMNFYLDQFFTFIDPDYISIVVNEKKQVVAFAITMPSLTNALKKSGGKIFPFGWYYFYRAFKHSSVADLYLMAVHPDLKHKGVSALLIEDLVTKFNKHRITKAYTHPISERDDTMLHFWKKFGPAPFRKRCCFSKSFDGTLN